MKRLISIGMTALALLLASGCTEKAVLTVTPIKDVDSVRVSAEQEQVDVYCPTGICQFHLASNQDIRVTVNMHYEDTRSFNKIEGVSITGELNSSVNMADDNTFSLEIVGDQQPLKILVVDYYRN